jgi:hypothetical protein
MILNPLLLPLFLLAAASCVAAPSNAFFAYTEGSTSLLVVTDVDTYNRSSLDRGWYSQLGEHQPGNTNYIVGFCATSDECGGDDLVRNNFFAFDLEGITGNVLSATLFLDVPSPNGYISAASSLIYTLYDVNTDIPSLFNGTGGVAAFNDLGSGILFGTHVATNDQEGSVIGIPLNAAALSALSEAIGGDFAIGGTLSASAVPEPASFLLAGSALALTIAARRRM